jgi:ribosomal protein S18 acetylase RimI-like enzyme
MLKENPSPQEGSQFLYYDGETCVGYIDAVNDCGTISGVKIYGEFRGKGLGKKMMQELVALLKKRGFHRLCMGVETHNFPALKAYYNAGFSIVGISTDKTVFLMEWNA